MQDALNALVAGPSARRDGAARCAPTCRRAAGAQRHDGRHASPSSIWAPASCRARHRHHARAARPGREHRDQQCPGVTGVQLLINGGMPIGLFPGVDATVPLTREALATPNVPCHAPVAPPSGPVSGLHAAPSRSASPHSATCCPTPSTASNGPGDGDGGDRLPEVAGPAAHRRSADARTRKVAVDRQAADADPPGSRAAGRRRAQGRGADRPPARAGDPGQPGGAGDRRLDGQAVDADADRARSRSTPSTRAGGRRPFREWLLWASPFTGGIAMHQYPDVPPYAASHGCVRVTQYDASGSSTSSRSARRSSCSRGRREGAPARRARRARAAVGRRRPRSPPTRRRRCSQAS